MSNVYLLNRIVSTEICYLIEINDNVTAKFMQISAYLKEKKRKKKRLLTEWFFSYV